jgi:uncharacterized RDD family membrane protein YckC/cytoskeletal protein CcmA (bactofilin family)
MKQTTNSFSKSMRRTVWALAVACSCSLAASAQAQQADASADSNQQTNKAVIQAEDAEKARFGLKSEDSTAQSALGATEWWDSDADSEGKAVRGVRRESVVSIRSNAELKAEDWADTVVAIGGSATALGKVRDAVVAIAGDVTVDNQSDEAVAILGDVTAGPAARIRGEIVAVGGNVTIKKGAKVHRDITAVGGRVIIEDGATVEGRVHEIDLGAVGFPRLNWLRGWFTHCFLLMRPLAPQVGWVWVIAIGLLAFYFVIAALFPRPVLACVNELTGRPATTFFMGLLTKLLFLPVLLILSATGIGLLVAPFILAALVLGAIVGKVAFLEFIGLKIGRHSSAGALHHPLIGLLFGAIILTLLYLVPFVGILTLAMTGIWGLGGAVVAAFGGMRREAAEKAALRKAAGSPPVSGQPGVGQPVTAENANPTVGAGQGTSPSAGAPSAFQTPLTDELAYPRAGFWERMGAAFLDMVIVGVVAGLTHVAPLGVLIAVAYFGGMWAWKQTTIGGIVIGLKVVRIDGRPFTFVTALVRALAAIFSVIVFFFGFIWIGWDVEKQGWHDKIAGTVVVRMPRGVPLVCF